MSIENAKKEDAPELTHLINLAGEGIPEYLWTGMVEGSETPMEVGARRASREEGGFSYRNARVIRDANQVAGMMIAYRLEDPYEIGDLNELPELIRPLIQLESQAPGSWYINAIATAESCRGRGIASQLMQEAESLARKDGATTMSLIVASENTTARSIYLHKGYEVTSSLPVVDYPGAMHGGDWELMIKTL